MNKEISVDAALEVVIQDLNDLKIPISLMEDIGMEIVRSIGILNACVKALRKSNVSKEDVSDAEESDAEIVADSAVETRPIIEG